MQLQEELRFELETQKLNFWCWASVSSGVRNYIASSTGTKITQCDVAKLVFPGAKDCTDTAVVDHPTDLIPPLRTVVDQLGWSLIVKMGTPPLTFDEIRSEIDLGHPIAGHILWLGGSGHYLVICGYRESDSGLRQLIISDPLFPDALVDFEDFCTNYQSEGTWDQAVVLERKS